ncbi:hypothetical protein BgiBS90_011742 [Biomphalaria glabrata]|nr:hypothetical protein BgiBS90_011742 [Biomphalaria glabrata]
MQNNFSVLSANSCFDRCDNYISFKCSCFVRCQIDGNCCQDFQETCPQTFNQSIARFSEFLQSLQECKYSDYLMISRCPSENPNTQQPSSSFQFDNTSGLISEALQNIAEGHGAVSLLFRQVPVIDLDSGVTFKNLSVYHCHNMSGRNILFWKVYIDNFQFGSHGELSQKSLSQAEFEVFPPVKVEETDRVLKCSKNKKLFYTFYLEVPETQFDLKAQVLKTYSSLCDVCRNNNEKLNKNPLNKDKSSFPISVSFTLNEFVFEPVHSYMGDARFLWLMMSCHDLKAASKRNVSYCQIHECRYFIVKNECKFLYHLQLAVPVEKNLMPGQFVNKLTSYVECYFEKMAGYKILNSSNKTNPTPYFSQRFDRIFYIFNFYLISNTGIDIENNLDIAVYHFKNFASVIKSVRALKSKLDDTQNPTELNTLLLLILVDFPKIYSLRDVFYFPSLTTLDQTKDNIIPICAGLSLTSMDYVFTISDLQCVYILEDKNISYTEKNICLNIFTFSDLSENKCSIIFRSFAWMFVCLFIVSDSTF